MLLSWFSNLEMKSTLLCLVDEMPPLFVIFNKSLKSMSFWSSPMLSCDPFLTWSCGSTFGFLPFELTLGFAVIKVLLSPFFAVLVVCKSETFNECCLDPFDDPFVSKIFGFLARCYWVLNEFDRWGWCCSWASLLIWTDVADCDGRWAEFRLEPRAPLSFSFYPETKEL